MKNLSILIILCFSLSSFSQGAFMQNFSFINFDSILKNKTMSTDFAEIGKVKIDLQFDTVKMVYLYLTKNGETETRNGYTRRKFIESNNGTYKIPSKFFTDKMEVIEAERILTYKVFNWEK